MDLAGLPNVATEMGLTDARTLVTGLGSEMQHSRPHLCFVALSTWPVLSGDRAIKSVGGAEVQQSILARAFVKRGYRVSMICMDYGQPDGVEIDGVHVFKAHTPIGGLPIVRFLHPRLTSIWAAMKRVDADIYYQRACGVSTGYTAAFCRHFARKFIYAAASDADFDPTAPLIAFRRDKAIYKWGLRRSDVIVVQNPVQVEKCQRVYGREPVLAKSCYVPPAKFKVDSKGYVLWVSTLRRLKQPELFIELAQKLPQYRFRMVGGAADPDYFDNLQSMAEGVSNLEFAGFIPHVDIEREFDGARLFVNTSEFEGFPNTFLNSWARAIPTVSFVDTGSNVNGHTVVNSVTTLDEMVSVVDGLMSDDTFWREAGALCADCFKEQHSLQAVSGEYETIFNELLG
jgi:glycosyltransferase involved in cell wall biosynthesis